MICVTIKQPIVATFSASHSTLHQFHSICQFPLFLSRNHSSFSTSLCSCGGAVTNFSQIVRAITPSTSIVSKHPWARSLGNSLVDWQFFLVPQRIPLNNFVIASVDSIQCGKMASITHSFFDIKCQSKQFFFAKERCFRCTPGHGGSEVGCSDSYIPKNGRVKDVFTKFLCHGSWDVRRSTATFTKINPIPEFRTAKFRNGGTRLMFRKNSTFSQKMEGCWTVSSRRSVWETASTLTATSPAYLPSHCRFQVANNSSFVGHVEISHKEPNEGAAAEKAFSQELSSKGSEIDIASSDLPGTQLDMPGHVFVIKDLLPVVKKERQTRGRPKKSALLKESEPPQELGVDISLNGHAVGEKPHSGGPLPAVSNAHVELSLAKSETGVSYGESENGEFIGLREESIKELPTQLEVTSSMKIGTNMEIIEKAIVWEVRHGYCNIVGKSGSHFGEILARELQTNDLLRSRVPSTWELSNLAIQYSGKTPRSRKTLLSQVTKNILKLGTPEELVEDYDAQEAAMASLNLEPSFNSDFSPIDQGPESSSVRNLSTVFTSLIVDGHTSFQEKRTAHVVFDKETSLSSESISNIVDEELSSLGLDSDRGNSQEMSLLSENISVMVDEESSSLEEEPTQDVFNKTQFSFSFGDQQKSFQNRAYSPVSAKSPLLGSVRLYAEGPSLKPPPPETTAKERLLWWSNEYPTISFDSQEFQLHQTSSDSTLSTTLTEVAQSEKDYQIGRDATGVKETFTTSFNQQMEFRKGGGREGPMDFSSTSISSRDDVNVSNFADSLTPDIASNQRFSGYSGPLLGSENLEGSNGNTEWGGEESGMETDIVFGSESGSDSDQTDDEMEGENKGMLDLLGKRKIRKRGRQGEISQDLETGLEIPLQSTKCFTPSQKRRLNSEKLYTVRQLLEYYPKTYVDYSNSLQSPSDGAHIAVVGTVISSSPRRTSTGLAILDLVIHCSSNQSNYMGPSSPEGDEYLESQDYTLNWRRFMRGRKGGAPSSLMAYLGNLYPEGLCVSVSGKVKQIGTNQFELHNSGEVTPLKEVPNEEVELPSTVKPVPVYPSCGSIQPKMFQQLMQRLLPIVKDDVDPLPEELREKYGLIDLRQAYLAIHNPNDASVVEKGRRRLVFDEFFFHQLGLLHSKQLSEDSQLKHLGLNPNSVVGPGALPVEKWSELSIKLLTSLPYKLTMSQEYAASEIMFDMRRPIPMSRLLQGDVGCGKTVVAVLAIMEAVGRGYQGAIMAPTEFLAQQHFQRISELLERLPEIDRPRIELLTGSTKRAKNVRLNIQTGETKIVVGTHALISESTTFSRLGLAVIDEQHRFGVQQRTRLDEKGRLCLSEALESASESGVESDSFSSSSPFLPSPHVLAMSATPIPRTLALALHGDMSLSQINELPPGRSPIITKLFVDEPEKRAEAYRLLREEVNAGGRAFIVFPLIEESANFPQYRAAEVEYEILATEGHLKGLRCGMVHGRMSFAEKEEAMKLFKSGETQVLVSTTVIEVGIDIPEATVMLVEHAERYGMAQLHQLRGRVGRGKRQALCLLITSTQNSLGRMKTLEQSQDGFFVAEMDMRFRGHGELLGKKQSGHLPEFHLARYETDSDVLLQAREAAEEVMKADRGLQHSPQLRRELAIRRPSLSRS